MKDGEIKAYPYRWIVLTMFMIIAAVQQLLWITFAAVTSSSAEFFGVSEMKIGFFSMCFMIVYIIVSIPASWVIDTYGFKIAVSIGAILTGVFGILRGVWCPNYNMVLIAQIGIAVGQPFITNAVTKVSVRWFPVNERATATGLGSLANYVGLIVGLIVTPYLVERFGIKNMLLCYGYIAIAASLAFLFTAKERPLTPPSPSEDEERALVFDGLKQMMHKREFLILLAIFFIGLGIFNGITTWIEEIVRPRGFTSSQAGTIGGLMIISGIFGALIIPMLSDRSGKRRPYLIVTMIGSLPGLVGLAYAKSYWLIILSACVFGFFMLSSGPIGFQYGAEIARPAPEGTSNGMLMLMGQISGILFIYAMNKFKSVETGSMENPMLGLIILMAVNVYMCTRLREPEAVSNYISN